MIKRRLFAGPIVCLVVCFLSFSKPAVAREEAAPLGGTSRLLGSFRVIDGDTLRLSGGERLRYLGVDTPEKGEPFFREATRYNRGLLRKGPVRIMICQKRPKDKYGRILAAVSAGDVDPVRELLLRGFGRVFSDPTCIDPETGEGYWLASRKAYIAGLGIWENAPKAYLRPERAGERIGRYALVCGVVRNVHRGEKALHLNFGEDWRRDFSVSVFARDQARLAGAGILPGQRIVGKSLVLFGYLKKRNGPHMVLSSPGQVSTVDRCPDSETP